MVQNEPENHKTGGDSQGDQHLQRMPGSMVPKSLFLVMFYKALFNMALVFCVLYVFYFYKFIHLGALNNKCLLV